MPMQRDAMREGGSSDLNTEDAAIIAKAGNDLSQLTTISNIKVDITDYQTLPEGKSWLHHAWSGDMLAAVLYYLPKGTSPEVISFWGPDSGGVVQNDTLWVIVEVEEARARARLPRLHARHEERLRQLRAVQRLHAAAEQDRRRLARQADGLIPKQLETAVLRPDQFANNQELLALSVEGSKLWQNAWAKFKAG